MDSDVFHGRPSGYSYQVERITNIVAKVEELEKRIAVLEAEREAGR